MPRTRTILALFALLATAPSIRASAQSTAPAEAADGGEGRAEAMELFRQSATEYREGRFAEAAELLRRAYALTPEPVLQYNLARALEGMGELDGAIEAYERYLEQSPDTEDRGSIEARLSTLRSQAAELAEREQAAPPPPPDEDPIQPPASHEASPAPWIVLGIGALGLGAGLGLGVHAAGLNDAAVDEPEHRRTVERVDEAQAFALAANVTLAVAGTIAIAGLIWGLVDVSSGGGDDDVALLVGPGTIALRATMP